MSDTAIVNSGADLAAMAPPDLFNGIGAADDGASVVDNSSEGESETFETPEALEGDSTEDAGQDSTDEADATAEADEAAAAEQQADGQQSQQQQGTQQQQEELPEGVVRGKDRNGKPGLFVEDGRWKTIYTNHQLVQRVSEMLGEPATPEALQLRNDAYIAQERLFNDLTSGDPQAQGAVIDYFLEELHRAREQGEVGVDPAVPLATTFYNNIREKSPDGYAALRHQAARDLIGEMFEEASASGDESLWLSAQHFARKLANVGKDIADIGQVRDIARRMGIPFYAKAEMQGLARGVDPVARLQAENARLQTQLNGRADTNQTAQFDGWFANVSGAVRSSVLDQAVKPALASVEAQWKEFPNDYNDLVVDRLHRKVSETIRADAGFNQRIQLLTDQARRAASAQRRDEIGKQIEQAYTNRAKLAAEAVKRPILEFAANRLKERADQTHARRQSAQNRTAPKGATGAVPRSLTPNNLLQMKDGIFDPKVAAEQARQLLFGAR
jgi:hypothetical protein